MDTLFSGKNQMLQTELEKAKLWFKAVLNMTLNYYLLKIVTLTKCVKTNFSIRNILLPISFVFYVCKF